MDILFCRQCGNRLILKEIGDEGKQRYCEKCDKFYFDNPAACVLVLIINENNEALLLKQKYIVKDKWTLCSGYLKKGETLEETVSREVFEETGQSVIKCEYIKSYFFAPKNLIMTGFLAYVNKKDFGVSNEVDGLKWVKLNKAGEMLARENNFSGEHFDNCIEFLNGRKINEK